MTKLTKEQENWIKYEKVRRGGKYNMITEGRMAAKEAGLTLNEYSDIIRRYSFIKATMPKEVLDGKLN